LAGPPRSSGMIPLVPGRHAERVARQIACSSTSARPVRARAPPGRPRRRPPADRRAGAAMTLSIVLPCYRSATTLRAQLPAFLEWLRRHYPDSEVIVVDDGSSDDGATERVARDNGCLFIGLSRNQGKGGAVRAGMKAATAQYRVFTDADIPFE